LRKHRLRVLHLAKRKVSLASALRDLLGNLKGVVVCEEDEARVFSGALARIAE
jgi:hypothetical protein